MPRLRRHLTIGAIGAGLLLAGLLALYLDWPRNPPVSESVPNRGQTESGIRLDSEGPLTRRDPTDIGQKQSEVYWRDYPNIEREFVARVTQIAAERGEAYMAEYIMRITEERRDTEPGQRLIRLVKRMGDTTMPTGKIPSGTFNHLLFGADAEVGNFLQSQLDHYREWENTRHADGYKAPLEEMRFQPLDFSPESYVSVFCPAINFDEIEPSLWVGLGDLRNRSLLLYSDLFQQQFILSYSINQAIRELGLNIPLKERPDALRHLVPQFASLEDQMRQIGLSYVVELRSRLIGQGFEVEATSLW